MSECNEFVCIVKEQPDGTTSIRKFKFECEMKDGPQKSEAEESKKEIISKMEVYDSEWDDDATIIQTSNRSFVSIPNPSSSRCISNRGKSPFELQEIGEMDDN
nr:uncharacterized protein LOC111419147 [Onthophagus taurus]